MRGALGVGLAPVRFSTTAPTPIIAAPKRKHVARLGPKLPVKLLLALELLKRDLVEESILVHRIILTRRTAGCDDAG